MTYKGRLRIASLVTLPVATVLLVVQPAFAQGFFWDSLGLFPGTVTRVEYENLTALRDMPHFQSLRKTYAGSALRDLERWLGPFGLREENITELVVGLEGGKGGTHIFAIAEGEFYPTLSTEAHSPGASFVPTKIDDLTGYCLGYVSKRQDCAVIRGQNWAAFGRREFLSYIVEGGNGLTEPLSSEPEFMGLAAMTPRDAPLSGVARGSAATAWLKAEMPLAGSVPVVSSVVVDGLDGLTYSATPDDDRVRITVNFEYKTSGGARVLGAFLEGAKAIQGVLGQMGQPGHSSPFSGAQVDVDDRMVSLTLSASYEALERDSAVGPGQKP